MLSLEGEAPFSFEAFRARCGDQLSARDRAGLDELAEPGTGDADHPFVRAWRGRDTQLRNVLAHARAARSRRDASRWLREETGFDATLERRASEAFARGDPQQRELALDRLRWEGLDELAGFDPFSGTAVLAYAMKLRLVERWAAMDEQAGAETAEALIAREAETQ